MQTSIQVGDRLPALALPAVDRTTLALLAGITHLGNAMSCSGEVVELLDFEGEACARVALRSANQYGQPKLLGEAIVALATHKRT
ncbi:hypothetical protein VARIO8X_90219 [Burkholderiales bacterium 8X]|nr:hypothetical protein VARIO8X_90219 [Burkholderiales bacterium 8X]